MDWENGLFGGDWEDYHNQHIQPLLDRYDGQINDTLSNGAHGEIAGCRRWTMCLAPVPATARAMRG